jgi:hypothetical protein
VDESDHDSASQSGTEVSDVAEATRTTIRAVWRFCTDWVERRSRLTQLLLSGAVALLFDLAGPLLDQFGSLWVSTVTSSSTIEALGALIGAQLLQTAIQTHKLETVRAEIGNMTNTPVSDGGRDEQNSWRTGGGALGGAITGGALGANFGSTGVVAGILFGAVFGDMFEEWIGKPNRNTRTREDHADFDDR